MNVLITGITGRVGANLASALVSEGHVVRGLVWSTTLESHGQHAGVLFP